MNYLKTLASLVTVLSLAVSAGSASAAILQPGDALIPAGLGAGDSFQLVFVTSTKVSADSMDGLADGVDNSVHSQWNAYVNTIADGSSLAGVGALDWRAVLSIQDKGNQNDPGVAANVNAPVTADVYRLEAPADGGPALLATQANFYTSTHLLPIKWNENGVEQNTNGGSASGRQVWSGSHSDGTIDFRPVGNSLAHIGSFSIRMGSADASNDDWLNTSDATRRGPTSTGRVYALSEVITVFEEIPNIPEPASLAMGLAGLGLIAARRRR